MRYSLNIFKIKAIVGYVINERKVKSYTKSHTQDAINTKMPTVIMQDTHTHTHTHTQSHSYMHMRVHQLSYTCKINRCRQEELLVFKEHDPQNESQIIITKHAILYVSVRSYEHFAYDLNLCDCLMDVLLTVIGLYLYKPRKERVNIFAKYNV